MDSNGENPRRLVQGSSGDRFLQVQWSPNGQRVAALKSHNEGDKPNTALEVVPMIGGDATTILSAPGLRSFCWSSDRRIIYSMLEPPPNDNESNLWELHVDSFGSKVSGSPRQITSWAGLSLSDLSVSADNKHLVFVNAGNQSDIYVLGLEGKGRTESPQRMTLEGRNNVPSAWTADGQALLFSSDRNGNWNIFRQSLQERIAQDFVVSAGGQSEPRLSPDASSVLYWDSTSKNLGGLAPARLLRMPISGGAPELVFEASREAAIHCARERPVCVLSELDKANGELVFAALDPVQGRKGEWVRLAADLRGSPAWDLSPDGSSVAIVDLDDRKDSIRLVELESGSSRLIAVGRGQQLSGITWSADGQSWFATSSSVRGSAIFQVRRDGAVSELWTTTSTLGTPLTSPDGKNLAFTVSTYNSNAWVIENF
jgi:Tol biopolymer transport system component